MIQPDKCTFFMRTSAFSVLLFTPSNLRSLLIGREVRPKMADPAQNYPSIAG